MFVRDGDFVMFDCYGLGFGELRLVPVLSETREQWYVERSALNA